MNRLSLVLCLLALLGSGVSAMLYFEIGNSKKILVTQLADTSARAGKLEADLASANEQNGALKSKVTALDADLGAMKIQFVSTEARATKLDGDLRQSRNVLSLYEQTARALAEEVSSLRTDLSDTRATHASPEAVIAYKNTIAELERQLANASRNGAAAPTAAGASTAVFTSRIGRATVMTVGAESAFVVLNFGSARGAQLGQKFSVNQGTDTVATVLISDVRTNFSIAQVLPDTLRGVLQKGDSALLIR